MTLYFNSSKLAATSNRSPQFQKTAPVLDFRCLFTRDVQRKQKRWQDGRLKLHTFNKRIMVHDERSNFVGDSYWQNENHLEEGEELSLQQNGIIVQVGEYMGKRDQDLDELVDKRLRVREERATAKLISRSISDPAKAMERKRNENNRRYPKPLNTVIQNGQIIPKLSHSEGKKLHENYVFQGPNGCELSTKRQKRDFSPPCKSTYVQNLMGAKVFLKSKIDPSSTIYSYKPVKTSFKSSNSSRTTIDLTKDDKNNPMKGRHEEIKRPKINYPLSAQNLTPTIDELNSSFPNSLTRAMSTTPDPIFTTKNPMNSESIIKRGNASIENLESHVPLTSITRKIQTDEEEILSNSTSLSPAPHNFLEKDDNFFIPSKYSSEISSISRNLEKRRKIQPSTATQNFNSLSGQSSSPTVSEVTIHLENSDIECNAILCDNSSAGRIVNQPKNTLRLKTKPRRKMMFIEGSVNSEIIWSQYDNTQRKMLKPKVKNKKNKNAKISLCKTQNTEVLSTSGVLTSPQNNQKDSSISNQINAINECTDYLKLRNDLSCKISQNKISNSKVPNQSKLISRSTKSTNPQELLSQELTDYNNHKDSILMHNNEVKKLKDSKRNVYKILEKPGNFNEKNLQGPEKVYLNTNQHLSKLSTPKLKFMYTEDKSSHQVATEVTPIASNLEIIKSFPKTMLSNPATRGIPLHTITASTVDALNIIGNITPPQSRALSRMEDSLYGCDPLNTFRLENSPSSFGPWSRESFDLFGIAKPP